MKTFIAALILSFTTSTFVYAAEPIKFSLECTVIGTKITGDKSSKQFRETFRQVVNPKYQIAYFKSDGKDYDASYVAITPEHIVTSFANVIGVGYNQKLLVFTHIIDLKALKIERIVTGVPIGSDERTQGVCRNIPQDSIESRSNKGRRLYILD
jgi:hypothetical protein